MKKPFVTIDETQGFEACNEREAERREVKQTFDAVCCGCQTVIRNGASYSHSARAFIMADHFVQGTSIRCTGVGTVPQSIVE